MSTILDNKADARKIFAFFLRFQAFLESHGWHTEHGTVPFAGVREHS